MTHRRPHPRGQAVVVAARRQLDSAHRWPPNLRQLCRCRPRARGLLDGRARQLQLARAENRSRRDFRAELQWCLAGSTRRK